MTDGQKAYEAYIAHQSRLAHDGSPLPGWDGVPDSNRSAWQAFSAAIRAGVAVDTAYNRDYLGVTGGKAFSGGPAPAFIFFEGNRPAIADAWRAAAAAVTP